jgi:P pilus assembly chaperone PapD
MTKITGFLCAASFVLTLASTSSAGSNYKIKGEVRPQSGGYQHIVIVKNKTRDWLSCQVWTDVDPQPPKSVRVGPRGKQQVVIRTRAEQDEFIPYGFCRNN